MGLIMGSQNIMGSDYGSNISGLSLVEKKSPSKTSHRSLSYSNAHTIYSHCTDLYATHSGKRYRFVVIDEREKSSDILIKSIIVL
jgi:hypothetical protein